MKKFLQIFALCALCVLAAPMVFAQNDEPVITATKDKSYYLSERENLSTYIRRYYKENGHFRLQPENDAMSPIILDKVSILGKVVGLYRKI